MAWRTTFKMKDLLSYDDVEPDVAMELGKTVAMRIRQTNAFLPITTLRFADAFECITDQEDFNEVLDQLYTAADRERVWIE